MDAIEWKAADCKKSLLKGNAICCIKYGGNFVEERAVVS